MEDSKRWLAVYGLPCCLGICEAAVHQVCQAESMPSGIVTIKVAMTSYHHDIVSPWWAGQGAQGALYQHQLGSQNHQKLGACAWSAPWPMLASCSFRLSSSLGTMLSIISSSACKRGGDVCVCVCVPLQLKAGTACWVCQAPRKPRADSAHEAGCSQRMQSTRHLMKQAALSACKAHVIWAGSTCSLI